MEEKGEVLEKDFEWIVRERLDRIENKVDALIKVIVPDVENKMSREDWEKLMDF